MEQTSIDFNPAPRARKRDPSTSHDAAARAASFAVSHRNVIMAELRNGPGTIKELAQRIGRTDLDHVAIARRMKELQEMAQAAPTNDRRDGCRVWVAA